MNSIDPLQLQRLIDGELDPTRVQQMLNDANATPEQWEQIATGFVENQLWSQAVVANAKPNIELVKPADSSKANLSIETKKNELEIEPATRTGFSWMAIAASMLLAVMLGYGISKIQNGRQANDLSHTMVQNQPKELSTPSIPDSMLAQNDNESNPGFTKANYHFEVPKDNEHLNNLVGQPENAVPLYRISNVQQLRKANEQRIKATTLPPEFVKRFTGSGYQMEQDIELISGKLGDGQTFIVPVQTIRFVSESIIEDFFEQQEY